MSAAAPELLALRADCCHITGRAGRLAVYSAGPPPDAAGQAPLLLVHSVNAAAAAAEVRPVFEHAALTRPVYALDLPGYGLSERSDRPYTPRLMTDALHDLLAHIGQRHGAAAVDVLGVSLGCEFVARLALEAPARVRRLALVSPTGFGGKRLRLGPPGGSVGPAWLLQVLRGPAAWGGGWGRPLFRGLTRPAVIRYFLQRTWGSKNIDEALWRYDVLTTRQSGAHFAPLAFLAAQLFSSDVNSLYDALQQPVWMSHGTRGDFTDYRLKSTVSQRANWRITVYADTGALMYFEKPREFNRELDAFLA